jgi:hypothetical protein
MGTAATKSLPKNANRQTLPLLENMLAHADPTSNKTTQGYQFQLP